MTNVPGFDIVLSEFELPLGYFVHFQTNIQKKGMKFLIPISYSLNNTITILLQELLCIKLPTKFDMPSNK